MFLTVTYSGNSPRQAREQRNQQSPSEPWQMSPGSIPPMNTSKEPKGDWIVGGNSIDMLEIVRSVSESSNIPIVRVLDCGEYGHSEVKNLVFA